MSIRSPHLVVILIACISAATALADWPQWRGANRDGKASSFNAPATWPKDLTQKWKVTVGEGVATPALVGDTLYVFSRQDNKEITRALDAATGKERWKDEYESQGATPPAQAFSGPRSSPAVADGKIVTLGVRGVLSCLDATTGKVLWRKDDFKGMWPQFFVSSSPIIVDGLCIAQLGSETKGGIVAYEMATGAEKWKWLGNGPAYGSPSLLTVDGVKAIVALTERQIVAVGVGDGKLLWKTDYAVAGKGRGYNAVTPMTEGTTLIYSGSGRGTKAVKIEKSGDGLAAKEIWNNSENSVQFNTPVSKDGLLFGLTAADSLFCINKDGKTAWTTALGGGGGGGKGRARPGYGSVVDVGSALLALTPRGELIVFAPSEKEFKELAKYKVGTDTHAYPIADGGRIFVKDQDSVILWALQ